MGQADSALVRVERPVHTAPLICAPPASRESNPWQQGSGVQRRAGELQSFANHLGHSKNVLIGVHPLFISKKLIEIF